MKKLFFAFAMLIICTACGGHKAESTSSVADSVSVVDSLTIDTTLVDTTFTDSVN